MELAERLREIVGSGELVLGTFMVELKSAAVPQLCRQAGMEFVMIDTEHGCYDPGEVAQLIMACKYAGVCPIVRVSTPDRTEVQRVLDAGAEGIIFPMFRTIEQVRRAVAVSKYPPLGERGCHMLRPHTHFEPPADLAAYNQRTNRALLTIVQIETVAAAAIADAIAAVDGVDALYLGPGDLGVDLGNGAGLNDPRIQDVLSDIVKACRSHGKIAASHSESPATVAIAAGLGAQMIGVSAVLRFARAALRELCEASRAAVAAG